MRRIKMFRFRAFFRACLLLAFVCAGAVHAQELSITPAAGWTYAANMLTITANGTYTITMATPGATTNADSIVVQSGVTANITLSDVSIDVSATVNTPAFDMTGATVNLILQGNNTLKSGNNRAGLQAPSGAVLTINGAGSLTATGGYSAAGIGGGLFADGGTIAIIGGTVTATGGPRSAGIGGGNGGAGGTITLGGNANVTAIGGGGTTAAGASFGGGSGIGSGGVNFLMPASAGTIVIATTGTVNTMGGASSGTAGAGAGIGEGGYVNSNGTPYHPIWFSVINAGAASGSTVSATYGGSSMVYGLCVPDGATVTITATGAGAASYTYAWSGTASGTGATYAPTVDSPVNAIVTVTGTGLRLATSVPTTGGGVLIALGVLLALVGIGYQKLGIRKN
jgi:hypothetical protein